MSTNTFNPQRTNLIWGVALVDGYAEGTIITVERPGEGVTMKTGNQGETAFIETANRQAIVTVRIMQTAKAMIAQLNLLFELGNVPAPLVLTDLSTGVVESCAAAKLERFPGVSYEKDVPVREFKWLCPEWSADVV